MNADEIVEALGLPDLLTLAAEIGIPSDQACGMWAGDLPVLLVRTNTLPGLNIPSREVKWLDERVFCKYVHDALHDTQDVATIPSHHEVPSDCIYLKESNLCLLNGVHQPVVCAFCDPEYDWNWVGSHSQTHQHQKGGHNAFQKG